MVTVSPYKIDVPQEVIDDLWERLHRTRWPDEVAGTGWRRGCDLSYMKELVKYWIDEYDWRNQETALNQHNHYQGNVDGLNIHFLHEKGKGPNPMPLFMMHGYPRDMIITNVMLYWVTNSFWSAIRLYSESYCHPWELMPGARIEVPTAVAAYPNWHQLFVNGQKDTIMLSISTSTQKEDISRSTRELKKCPLTYANSSVLLGEKKFFYPEGQLDNCHIASSDSVSCRFLILPCKFNRSVDLKAQREPL